MIEKFRQLIIGSGVSENVLALLLGITTFIVLNASLIIDFRFDQLWTRIPNFIIVIGIAGSAIKEKHGFVWGKTPVLILIGWILLSMIPIVNAVPASFAGRNWAKMILNNNG